MAKMARSDGDTPSDSATGVVGWGQVTVSKGIRRNRAIRAGSGGYWSRLTGYREREGDTDSCGGQGGVSKKWLEDTGRQIAAQIRCRGRSWSALGSGSGVRVELGGDQTGPVFLRLAVAKLGLEVEADEGMKNVVGQERHQDR